MGHCGQHRALFRKYGKTGRKNRPGQVQKTGVKAKIAKCRKNLAAGTVMIGLVGKYRGSRCVFIKHLEKTGLLLVTGPHEINGSPLRRLHPRMCIATSTKVDLAGCDFSKIDDGYFKRLKPKKEKLSEKTFWKLKNRKAPMTEEQKDDEMKMCAPLVATIKKDDLLRQYMKSRFALLDKDYPHEMKF